ncbi:DUF4123 domain-containing protein [Stenotrophomonas sp. SY1]|uniref:DUF4123 domain-containing protein n=1 Tax=Stenotrophomonas sp. SY1 TaxID=477235 RepID=UPI001E5624D3|nr:DUF4123 domain-containing protein [Stenotrophomonas sp. SY1]MCD9087050.1 DUF4123 domain-containing protein [Stenotrophomonas sp. SY1]
MLDRFLGNSVDLDVFAVRGCDSAEVRLRHPAFTDISRTPLLLRIRPEDSDLIALVLDWAMREQAYPYREAAVGLAVAGWMETSAPLETLVRHLAAAMEQRIDTSGQLRVLRLSDRRVLEYVWELLDSAQQVSLLGPITAWHFIDRCDAVRSIGCTSADQDDGIPPESLRLSPGQWLQLEQCQQIQEMARGWRGMVDVLPRNYLHQLRAALAAAKRLGLVANHDVQLLAAYILQIHPLLASHHRVVELVGRSIVEGSPLQDALAVIPDPEGWEQIKSELELIKPQQYAFDAAHT